MAKKKTSVILPMGIKNLVHKAQGLERESDVLNEVNPEKERVPKSNENNEGVKSSSTISETPVARLAPEQLNDDKVNEALPKDRSAPAAKKLPKAEGKELAREYTMEKIDVKESWQLFLDLSKEYKLRDSKLATVYIDADLKSVLDRLKSANSIKMPSTALLSSIVARFIFDHEKEIKDAIYGDSLL